MRALAICLASALMLCAAPAHARSGERAHKPIVASKGVVEVVNAETNAQPSQGAAFVAEFRLSATGATTEALAWRSQNTILVATDTLRSLGVDAAPSPESDLVSLAEVPGLSFEFVASEQAVLIRCTSACFSRQTLGGSPAAALPIATGKGAFLNIDVVASRSEEMDISGAFELGLFGEYGFGGTSWTAGAGERDRLIRLDTTWTLDFPESRTRLNFGDAIAHAGGVGAPFRFGGIQFGTDFSLDPTFVPFPTPTFEGEAATASVVDFYVNGALRTRQTVEPGPFEIVDAPLVAGGGLARIVVTDALGRQTVVEAPFYASPSLLRPGLADYAVALGAERERYALESARYGRGFLFGSYRRGLTQWATAEARGEVSEDFVAAAAGLSLGGTALGQLDLSIGASQGEDGDGGFARVAWALHGPTLSFSADVAFADDGFRRLGMSSPLPQVRARATVGLSLNGFGRVSTTGVWEESTARGEIETLELSYSAAVGRAGAISFSALHVDDGDASTGFMLTFTRAFGRSSSGAVSVESRERGVTTIARAQTAPRGSHGVGWRASVAQGEINRFDGAAIVQGQNYDARLEVSATPEASGQRGQFATSLAWIDGAFFVARPVRESFAMVEVGASDVDIYRDGQWAARTNRRGRALLTGLRAYEPNRISLDVDDLPFDAEIRSDEITIRPAARSGASVRFPVALAGAGEVQVVDASGAPLPEGAILVRSSDSRRFPVGRMGRAYVSGVSERTTFIAERQPRCQVDIDAAAIAAARPLICREGRL